MNLRQLSRLTRLSPNGVMVKGTGYSRQKLCELASRGLIKLNRMKDHVYTHELVKLLRLRRAMNARGVCLRANG